MLNILKVGKKYDTEINIDISKVVKISSRDQILGRKSKGGFYEKVDSTDQQTGLDATF